MWFASPEKIVSAVALIEPVFLNTPIRRSAALDQLINAEILFKDETQTPIRSFKGRGACALLAAGQDRRPIVCASAGNFGQAIAFVAAKLEIPVTVFAARSAIRSKIEAMRQLGATVILEGDDFDSAKEVARRHAELAGLRFVEDGAHPEIAEGAGTLALESCEGHARFDAVLCPLGNGALAAGVGSWFKHVSPRTEVHLVAAAGAPAMARSVQAGEVIESPGASTIADGIAVRVPIESAVHAVRAVHDSVSLVADDEIRTAQLLIKDALEIVVEPSAAVGLALALQRKHSFQRRRLLIPLTGANI